jgi:hypothetical protein
VFNPIVKVVERIQFVCEAMDIQYTYDYKLKKIREMLLTTLEHDQHDGAAGVYT